MSRYLEWLLRSLVVLVAAVLLGYISDAVSAPIAERQVARWIAFDVFAGYEFYVLEEKSKQSLPIFQKVGAKVRLYRRSSEVFEGFPWGEVQRATYRYPFVIAVRWGYVIAPTAGEGATRRFFCLFGYLIKTGDFGNWST
jgi:hypothetical protein